MQIRNGSISLVGVPVDNLSMEDTLARIEAYIAEGGFHQIATANVNFLVNALRIPELHRVLSSCDVVVPDGMPLVWGSRLMGQPLQDRVCGSDLVPRLAELSHKKGYSIYFLGAREENSRRAVERLQQQYPNMRVAGRDCPLTVTLDSPENAAILERVRQANPDILLVAFGNPKQDLWLSRFRDQINVPVTMGIGGSLEMVAGFVQRAPRFLQKTGMEWLYRLVQEPRRLAGRYFRDFTGFFLPLGRQWASLALQGKPRTLTNLTLNHTGDVTVLRLEGGLSAQDMARICALLESDPDPRRHLLMEMSQIHYLGADALAVLLRLASLLHRHEGTVWLTGLSTRIAQMLSVSNAGHLLRSAKTSALVVERFPEPAVAGTYGRIPAQRLLHTEALRYQA
jgi:N-acetylglucosaminyldiphosphoundecaprenol N-acetyl-beta-D-mannosaminyltransferase